MAANQNTQNEIPSFVIEDTSNTENTPNKSNNNNGSDNTGLSDGEIAAIALGGVAGLAALGAAATFGVKSGWPSKQTQPSLSDLLKNVQSADDAKKIQTNLEASVAQLDDSTKKLQAERDDIVSQRVDLGRTAQETQQRLAAIDVNLTQNETQREQLQTSIETVKPVVAAHEQAEVDATVKKADAFKAAQAAATPAPAASAPAKSAAPKTSWYRRPTQTTTPAPTSTTTPAAKAIATNTPGNATPDLDAQLRRVNNMLSVYGVSSTEKLINTNTGEVTVDKNSPDADKIAPLLAEKNAITQQRNQVLQKQAQPVLPAEEVRPSTTFGRKY
jgi:hypothetical protein